MLNKKFLVLIVMIVAMLSIVVFTGCDEILTVDSITIKCLSDNPSEIKVGEFSYSDYVVEIHYSDGSVGEEPLTENMISSYDKIKILQLGRQDITVSYQGKSATISFEVVSKKQEGIYMNDVTTTYDGVSHFVEVAGDIPELAEIVYIPQQNYTDAGIYHVKAIVSAPNFETTTLEATITINKAVYDLTAVTFEDSPIYTYDNTAKYLSIKLDGSLPAGLSYSYTIGTTQGKYDNDPAGNFQTNAGTYYVSCVFKGDFKNYESKKYSKTTIDNNGNAVVTYYDTQEGLRLVSVLQINKASASSLLEKWGVDLDELTFKDEEWTYSGQARTIQVYIPKKMESLLEKNGIRVEYYCDGRLFKGAKDAGVYEITAKFQLDSTVNYQIDNDKHATLTINKATFDPKKLNFESQTLAYDTEEHMIEIKNLPESLQLIKYTVNGEEYQSGGFTEAGEYNITAYFNTDKNHVNLDPITIKLTINPITFGNPYIEFNDQEETYNDGQKYSFNYTITGIPIGVKTFITTKNDNGDIINGYPKDKSAVGKYECNLSFEYNMSNYIGAKELANKTSYLIINKRVFNAEELVPLVRVDKEYTGYNLSDFCKYTVEIPTWVKLATKDSLIITKATGESVDVNNMWESGMYKYQFKFEYFDGVDVVNAYTLKQDFKIIGKPISEKTQQNENGRYTYKEVPNFTYDGITSALPTFETCFTEAEQGVCTLVYRYQPVGGEKIVVKEQDYDFVSTQAGTHSFEYSLSAYNFEPTIKVLTTEVAQQEMTLDTTKWSIIGYQVDYYSNRPYGRKIVEGSQENIGYSVKLTEGISGSRELINCDTYKYEVTFASTNSNYKLVNAPTYNPTIIINPLNIKWGINPSNFRYGYGGTAITFSTNTYVNANDITLVDTYNDVVDLSNYKNDSVDTNRINLLASTVEFSARSLFCYLDNENSANTFLSSNNYVINYDDIKELIEGLNAKYAVYYKEYGVLGSTYKKVSSGIDNICDAGEYYIVIDTCQGNILFSGSSAFVYHIVIQPIELQNLGVDGLASVSMNQNNGETSNLAIGFGYSVPFDYTNESELYEYNDALSKYKGLPLYTVTLSASNNLVKFDSLMGLNLYDKVPSNNAAYYQTDKVRVELFTLYYDSSNKLTIVKKIVNYSIGSTFNVLLDAAASAKRTYSGRYYFVITNPANITVDGNRKYIWSITIEQNDISFTDSIEVIWQQNALKTASHNANSVFSSTGLDSKYASYNGTIQFDYTATYEYDFYGAKGYTAQFLNDYSNSNMIGRLRNVTSFKKVIRIAKDLKGNIAYKEMNNVWINNFNNAQARDYAFYYDSNCSNFEKTIPGDYYFILELDDSGMTCSSRKCFVIHLKMNPVDSTYFANNFQDNIFADRDFTWGALYNYKYYNSELSKLGDLHVKMYSVYCDYDYNSSPQGTGRSYDPDKDYFYIWVRQRDFIGTISVEVKLLFDDLYYTSRNLDVTFTVKIKNVVIDAYEKCSTQQVQYDGTDVLNNSWFAGGGNNCINFKKWCPEEFYNAYFKHAEDPDTGKINGLYFEKVMGAKCYYKNAQGELVQCTSLDDYDKDIVVINREPDDGDSYYTMFGSRYESGTWCAVAKDVGSYYVHLRFSDNTYCNWNDHVYYLYFDIVPIEIYANQYINGSTQIHEYTCKCDGTDKYNSLLDIVYNNVKPNSDYYDPLSKLGSVFGDDATAQLNGFKSMCSVVKVEKKLYNNRQTVTSMKDAGEYYVTLKLKLVNNGINELKIWYNGTALDELTIPDVKITLENTVYDVEILRGNKKEFTYGFTNGISLVNAYKTYGGYNTFVTNNFGGDESKLTALNFISFSGAKYSATDSNMQSVSTTTIVNSVGSYLIQVNIIPGNLPSYVELYWYGRRITTMESFHFYVYVYAFEYKLDSFPQTVETTHDDTDYMTASNLKKIKAIKEQFYDKLPSVISSAFNNYESQMPISRVVSAQKVLSATETQIVETVKDAGTYKLTIEFDMTNLKSEYANSIFLKTENGLKITKTYQFEITLTLK